MCIASRGGASCSMSKRGSAKCSGRRWRRSLPSARPPRDVNVRAETRRRREGPQAFCVDAHVAAGRAFLARIPGCPLRRSPAFRGGSLELQSELEVGTTMTLTILTEYPVRRASVHVAQQTRLVPQPVLPASHARPLVPFARGSVAHNECPILRTAFASFSMESLVPFAKNSVARTEGLIPESIASRTEARRFLPEGEA